MTLSDLTVRQAKAAEKTYSIPDTDGLGLVVARTGGKSWHLRYYWLGKQKRISLGNYPEIGLREARTLRDEARALLAKGVNPHTDRKQKRHAVKLAADYTFKAVFDAWVEHRRKEIKEGRNSTLSQILRIFNKDVLPSLKQMSIYDIRRPQLLGVLARIEERKAFTTAEKVRTWLGQLFRYALVIVEGLEANPASDLDVVAEPKPPVNHNPYLHLPELPEFLHKLRLYNPRGWQTQLGIRLLFLTGVRTGELRLATPDQFDLDRGLWIIPPQIVKQLQDEMRKAGKRPQDVPPYIVPLSVQAIEIVRYLLGVMRPAQVHLLTHRSELKKRISENTLNAALKRMGYKDQLTGHGIRGTISTALNEIGYPKIWVDAQLSHSDPIFIRDRDVWTGAGLTACLDLALALVADDFGERLALRVARQLVMFLKRPSGQSQFSASLEPASKTRRMDALRHYIMRCIGKPMSIAELAEQAHVSDRQLTRIFKTELNMTPAAYIESVRVEMARNRLETTDEPLERIATTCGFNTTDALNRAFRRTLGTTPAEYRSRFRTVC